MTTSRRDRNVLSFVLSFCAISIVCGEENWPQFRGPRGDGKSDAVGLPVTWSETENVKWKTPLRGKAWSSPVIWDKQVWLTTAGADGKEMFAICLDRETGAVIHDLKLFENEKPSTIHDLNSYASPTPAIEEGRVYVTFGSYGTACLDTATGKTLWSRRDLPCEHWRGPGSSPIIFENLLILHYDGYDYQYVVAFDKKTGENVWKVNREIDFGTTDGDVMKAYCTPLLIEVAGKKQLISPASKASITYDPATGKELWRVKYGSFSATVMPMFGNGLVYINTGFGKADLIAVKPDGEGDVTKTHVAWTVKKQVPSKPSQLLVDDLIFMVHDGGTATCLDAKTGEEVWTKRIKGQYSGSPLYAAGKLYFFSQEGPATVLKAGREFEQLAENQLDDGFMASPAVAGKSLFIRTKKSLYCLEAK